MKVRFNNYYRDILNRMEIWGSEHLIGLFVFNLLLILLLLLRSGGYFSPYFVITINTVVFMALVGSVVLIGARSGAIFLVALFFWIFALFLRLLGVEVWAERTSVYTYQALFLGVVLIILENVAQKDD